MSEKQKLLNIVQEHEQLGTKGAATANDLDLNEIPGILKNVNDILRRLEQLANDGSTTTFRGAFSDLYQASKERADSLCSLTAEMKAANPSRDRISQIAQSLSKELVAICVADAALVMSTDERRSAEQRLTECKQRYNIPDTLR
jgi:hypothetical protein